MANPKRTTVTQPPNAQSLAELLNDFLLQANLSPNDYENITKNASGYESISSYNIESYLYRNSFPSNPKKHTIIYMFDLICSESVKQQWIDSFANIERERRERKKTNKKSDNLDNELDTINKEKKHISNKKLSHFKVFSIISSLCLTIWIFSWNFNKETPITPLSVIKNTAIDNTEKDVFDSSRFNNQTNSIVSNYDIPSKTKKLLKGLSLDVYSFRKDKYKTLPSTPEGFKVATLPFNKGGYFTFVDHVVDKNIATATADKDVGLNYQGFINLKGNGEFIFQLDYQSGEHFIQQFPKKCRLVLKVNNESIFDKRVYIGQGQSDSMQNAVAFSEGLNTFSFWFTCPNLRSFSPKQDYNAFKDTSVTLYIKQPDDNKITKITADKFSYGQDNLE